MSKKQDKAAAEQSKMTKSPLVGNDELSSHDLEKVSGGSAFDIEQTLNIGSQSTGAGAGKVTFNPFSITRKIDVSSLK
jgi:hypothetical protein